MLSRQISETELSWRLLYTKPHAEAWVDLNLRKQGYSVLLPRIATRSGFASLFPRYIFAGFNDEQSARPLQSTLGVLYVVHCGDRPARVPLAVIAEIRSRMDSHGVVSLEPSPTPDPLFAKRERERVRALVQLARAGYRVISA